MSNGQDALAPFRRSYLGEDFGDTDRKLLFVHMKLSRSFYPKGRDLPLEPELRLAAQ